MTNHVRPLLLGYIRADLLPDRADLPRVEAQLEAFAHREAFSLGAVYVERGSAPGAFDALMTEVTRDEATQVSSSRTCATSPSSSSWSSPGTRKAPGPPSSLPTSPPVPAGLA